jgi:hypothetical protein
MDGSDPDGNCGKNTVREAERSWQQSNHHDLVGSGEANQHEKLPWGAER